jgi:hypothetical protein
MLVEDEVDVVHGDGSAAPEGLGAGAVAWPIRAG